VSDYELECPSSPFGSHVFGTRTKCLICAASIGSRPRTYRWRSPRELDETLNERPGVLHMTGRAVRRSDGIDDVAGWGEDGDPWMGGAS
jgi:hypothetical protein